MKTKTAVALVALALAMTAAKKDRNWQTGTLEETAHASSVTPGAGTVVVGGGSPVYAGPYGGAAQAAAAAHAGNAAALVASQPRIMHLQGYRIEGNGFSFMVSVDITRGKIPNVTVHGPIKYALEDGTFYLLDEDGREFKAKVLEKALLPPPAAPAIPPGYEIEKPAPK